MKFIKFDFVYIFQRVVFTVSALFISAGKFMKCDIVCHSFDLFVKISINIFNGATKASEQLQRK